MNIHTWSHLTAVLERASRAVGLDLAPKKKIRD